MTLGKDSIVLQFSALVRAGAGLASVVLLSHLLGAQGQGEYFSAVAAFSALYLVGATGFASLTVSRIAECAHDAVELARWTSFLAFTGTAAGLFLGLVGWLLHRFVPGWLALSDDVGRWFALLCWTPLLELPRTLVIAGLQGTRRMPALAGLEVASEIVRVVFVVLGARATGDPGGCVAGWLLASGASSGMAALVLHRERCAGSALPGLLAVARTLGSPPRRSDLREALALGWMRNSSALTKDSLPALITARMAGAEWVAYLRVGQRVCGAAQLFGSGVARTSLPALGEVAHDPHLLRRTWLRASLTGAASIAAALLVILALLPLLLDAAMQSDYREPVLRIAWLLAPAVLLSSIALATDAFHLATRTVRVGLWITLIGVPWGVGVLVAAIRFDPRYGAAWGLSVASVWVLGHPIYAWRWFARASRAESGGLPPRRPEIR